MLDKAKIHDRRRIHIWRMEPNTSHKSSREPILLNKSKDDHFCIYIQLYYSLSISILLKYVDKLGNESEGFFHHQCKYRIVLDEKDILKAIHKLILRMDSNSDEDIYHFDTLLEQHTLSKTVYDKDPYTEKALCRWQGKQSINLLGQPIIFALLFT